MLIADGGSTDKTREIVREISGSDPRVKLVDNPEKFQSYALNKMIAQAEGEIFLRADGHCYYQEDYLPKCVEVMQKTGAKNVGGSQRYMAKNKVQAGIALAVKSFLGNGGAAYMNEQYEGYADTVFLGCFKTEDLRKVGGFNTENVTNQDSELNLRLIEEYGEAVYVSPEIKSWYYPRDSFAGLFKQYFRYGRGRFLTKVLHPKSSPVRSLAPFTFLLFLILYVLTDLFSGAHLYSMELLLFFSVIVIAEGARVTVDKNDIFKSEIWRGENKIPGRFSRFLNVVTSVIMMQVAHFTGFLYQMVRRVFLRKKGW